MTVLRARLLAAQAAEEPPRVQVRAFGDPRRLTSPKPFDIVAVSPLGRRIAATADLPRPTPSVPGGSIKTGRFVQGDQGDRLGKRHTWLFRQPIRVFPRRIEHRLELSGIQVCLRRALCWHAS